MLWLADAPHACTASEACDEIAERVIPFLLQGAERMSLLPHSMNHPEKGGERYAAF